jgi:hypothetical protein
MIFNARKKDIFPISFRGTYKAVQICAAFIFVPKKRKRCDSSALPRVFNFAHPFFFPDRVSKAAQRCATFSLSGDQTSVSYVHSPVRAAGERPTYNFQRR